MVKFNKSTQGFGHDECYISENDGSILVYPKLYSDKPKNETVFDIVYEQPKNHESCIIL